MKRITALLIAFVMALTLSSFAAAQTKTTKTTVKKTAPAATMQRSKKAKKSPLPVKHPVAKTSKSAKPMRTRHGKTTALSHKTSKVKLMKKPVKTTHAARKVSHKPTLIKKSSKQVQKK